jgi:protease I
MPRAMIIVYPGFEDIEALYPYYRLLEAGFETLFISKERGNLKGRRGYVVRVLLTLKELDPEDFDVLVIPSYSDVPSEIKDEDLIKIIRHFIDQDKPLAAIGQGPLLLANAGRVKGRRLTSHWSIRDYLEAAGSIWVDEPVVVDDNLVTSRHPNDIPFWAREFLRALERRGLLSPIPKRRPM